MSNVRWGVHLSKISGGKRTGKTVTLVDSNGDTVVSLTQYNSEPTGFYRSLAIPPGSGYDLAIDGAVVSDPFYQDMDFIDPDALGHTHPTCANGRVDEATWTAVEVGGKYRYTFTLESGAAMTAGTLRVYVNGVLLPSSTVYGTSHDLYYQEVNTTTFYIWSSIDFPFNGYGTTAKGSWIAVEYRSAA